MSYKFRLSTILADLKDNPLVPKEFKAKLDTLWLLDLAGNDTEFTDTEAEWLIDLANSYILPPAKTNFIKSCIHSRGAYTAGLGIKTSRRY